MNKWILVALFGMASAQAFADNGMMTQTPEGTMQSGGAMTQSGGAMTKDSGMTKMGAMAKPEFGGACPVGLAKAHKKVQGKAEFSAMYKGKTYCFSSAKARAMFKKHPKSILAMAKKEWRKLNMMPSM